MANRPLDNGTRVGDYTVVRRISNGGMGMVYLARTDGGQPVVIKEYLPQHLNLRKQGQVVHLFNSDEQRAFESGMQDFFSENEVLSKIQHPNVVRVLDSFLLNHTAYSVMEYVYGQSLQHIVQGEGTPGLKESFIRRVFLDVLSGVSWLHKNRILHLDIKPSNIYVTHKGNAMLLDFGTAWLLDFDTPEKRKRIPMHTPGFAPPEQHKAYYLPARLGPQTDVYALGCAMYSCIKGSPPPSSLERIEEGTWTESQQEWMGLYSPWLLQAIDRMMILEWDRRPKSVEQLWHLFETSQAVNQENPVKLQLHSLISRTQSQH